MSWQILLFISVITFSISTILQRVILKEDKTNPIAFAIVFQAIVGLILAIFAIFTHPKLDNIQSIIPNILLMTILYTIGNIFKNYSLKKIDASEFTISFASRSLFTILGASIFLHEIILPKHILGTILILSSIVLIFWKKQKFSLNSGLIFSLLAAICFGLSFVNDAYILRNFDVFIYSSLAFFLPALMTLISFPTAIKHMKKIINFNNFYKLFFVSLMFAIACITSYLAVKVGNNSAQIAPLYQTSIIITILLSIIFLKERNNLFKKLIGAIITFIGIICLM